MLITSELTNQSARKALFTCVLYTKYHYFLNEIGLVSLQITIYDMNEDGTDIDRAILTALLKGLLTCMVYAYNFNFLLS